MPSPCRALRHPLLNYARQVTAAPALPTALLVALSCLHGACASRSELRSPSVAPLEEPAADPQCTAVTQYAATEIERGQWLRARHLLRLAEPRCAEPVAQALARLHAELQDERTPKALLHSAQTARQTGDDQSAGLAEAKAVLALERQSGQPLRVLGRLAVSDWDWSRDGKHVSVKRGDVLEVHDLPSAEVLSRIPRERLTEELELNTKVRRLVVRAGSDECNATINVYDSQTGAKLRSPCGEDWQFSADGSRLAILEQSQRTFSVTLLDSTTLELLARIPTSLDRSYAKLRTTPRSNAPLQTRPKRSSSSRVGSLSAGCQLRRELRRCVEASW